MLALPVVDALPCTLNGAIMRLQHLFLSCLLFGCTAKDPLDTGDTEGTTPDPIPEQNSLSWTPVGEDGWTHYAPHEDTVVFYVSASEGDDANDGLSEASPVQTIARGLALVKERSQDATVPRPDWLLFKAGDTWTEGFAFRYNTVKGGLSIEYPFLISSYGEGERPHFIWPESGPMFSYGWWGNGDDYRTGDDAPAYWSVIGLSFTNPVADPSSSQFEPTRIYGGSNPPTVYFAREIHHLLIEDCKAQYTSLTIQLGPRDVALRRNLILDNFGYHDHEETDEVYHHAGGLYMNEVEDVLIEGNFLDHNGWLSSEEYPTTAPTIYNHNIYLNSETTGVVLHQNITTRASADGFKARGGGKIINNLAMGNGININMNYYAHEGVETTVRYNVVMKSLNQALHGPASSYGHHNRDWGVSFGWVNEDPVNVVGNIVAHSPEGGSALTDACRAIPACLEGHVFYSWGEEPDSEGDFPDPKRNLESYLTSIGETATFEAFLKEARKQSKANWRPEYTAAVINDYIREGFGVVFEAESAP